MEIDIGNLLYIAFVALILIANAFKKKKKTERRRHQNPGPVLADPRKSFEELLQEFTNPSQPDPPLPPARPEPIAQPAAGVESVRPAEPFKKKEHSAMKTEYGKFNELEKSEPKPSPYAEAFHDLDNARRAFVYSEIFRRKF